MQQYRHLKASRAIRDLFSCPMYCESHPHCLSVACPSSAPLSPAMLSIRGHVACSSHRTDTRLASAVVSSSNDLPNNMMLKKTLSRPARAGVCTDADADSPEVNDHSRIYEEEPMSRAVISNTPPSPSCPLPGHGLVPRSSVTERRPRPIGRATMLLPVPSLPGLATQPYTLLTRLP